MLLVGRRRGFRCPAQLLAGCALGATLGLGAANGLAQPAPAGPPPGPVPPPAVAATPATDEAASDGKLVRDPVAEALRPAPGGLDADAVGRLAARSSYTVAALQAELRAASAAVDQALVGFVPIVKTSFAYSRLSPVDNSMDLGISVPGMDSGFEFPSPLNSYSWDTQVAVPFSDYLLRLTQAYAAAKEGEESKRLSLRAEQQKTASDAKVAYFNWLRAKANRAVAELSVEQVSEHIKDARVTLEAGLLSRADLLRLESQLAQTEQLAASMKNLEVVTEKLLRTSLHAEPTKPLYVGIDVLATPGPTAHEATPLPELERRAMAQRVELKAIDAGRRALEAVDAINLAGYFPRLDGFFQMSYANPNSRYFLAGEAWNLTWVLGVQASWTLNDTLKTIGTTKASKANIEALTEQRRALEDGIALSVTAAYTEAQNARSAIAAAERAEVAAAEGLRVRRDLFRAGKATSTDIVDAETELTRVRLQRVGAHVDLLVAQAKLAYAAGTETVPDKASAP